MHAFAKNYGVSAKMVSYLQPYSRLAKLNHLKWVEWAVPVVEGKWVEAARQTPFGQIGLLCPQLLMFHNSVGEEYSPPGPE